MRQGARPVRRHPGLSPRLPPTTNPTTALNPNFPSDYLEAARRDPSGRSLPPEGIVHALEITGLASNIGRGWGRSRVDETWNAMLIRGIGENEVSALLESSSPQTVDLVEIEAELYKPRDRKVEVIVQFAGSIAAVYPNAKHNRSLADAIASESPWSGDGWTLERIPYGGGGHGLMFRRGSR